MIEVKNKKELIVELQAHLPKCHMCFDEIEGTYFNEVYKLRKCKPTPDKKKNSEITVELQNKRL